MTSNRSIDPDPSDALLPDEDQTRLRWLREDLTSCLGEVGDILRRASGEHGTPASFCIAIEAHARAADSTSLAGEVGEDTTAPPHPAVTISWTGADGAAVLYDWRTGALHRDPAPG